MKASEERLWLQVSWLLRKQDCGMEARVWTAGEASLTFEMRLES